MSKYFDIFRSSLLLILCSLGTLALDQHSSARACERPNVILIVSDDQRPDTIAALGNDRIKTPSLDALVRRGSVMSRATCANPICTPSRAELLTGCSGFRTGVLDFGKPVSDGFPGLAQQLSDNGYQTFYVGKWHNAGKPHDFGYQHTEGLFTGGGGRWWKDQVDAHGRPVTGYRGWIFQTDTGQKLPELGVGLTPEISRHFADAAIRCIEQPKSDPFFVHVNFTAPHDPLLVPPAMQDAYDPQDLPIPVNFAPQHPFDTGNINGRDEQLLPMPRTSQDVREDLAVYYAVITYLDQQVGRIMEALKATSQLENTVVIFTSDHGLAMGSHGLRGKQNMYEHTIGVPMIIAGPGIPSAKRFESAMYLRDLYPTICELTGTKIPQDIDGRSIVPVLTGQTDRIHQHIFGYFRNYQRMIRTDRWKLIHYPQVDRWQLFDLVADPAERTNLVDLPEHRDRVASLQSKLKAWQRSVDDPCLSTADAESIAK